MLKSYLRIAWRNLKRQKVYAIANISGLALGIACAILIFTLIKYHLSFDTYHTKADRIYRITTVLHQESIVRIPGVPSSLGAAFRNDYSFAEKVVKVFGVTRQLVSVPSLDDQDHKKFEEDVAFAEPAFFDVFDFPFVQGSKQSALGKPNTAIITEKIARKYFGTDDPMGKSIRVDNKRDFIITGILRDLPDNTDRRQEIYLPFDDLEALRPWVVEETWLNVNSNMHCFVLLKPGVSASQLNKALAGMRTKYYDAETAKQWEFRPQHISDIHFNAELGGYIARKNLWALALIGFFLIITACVNFVNLATAQAVGRSREIGVRKALGSYRWQLFWQFITETALIAVLALLLALTLSYIALPYINQLFNIQLRLDLFSDRYLLLFLPILLLAVTFFSGSYPGLVLACFQPVMALRGRISQQHAGRPSLRRGLVITQFAISQLLIIGAIVIANQMRYSTQKNMGFQKEAIAMFPLPNNEKSKLSALRSQLSQVAGVEKATFCYAAPVSKTANSTNIRFDARTEGEKFPVSYRVGDDQYISAFGLKVVAGRNLYPSDTIREYLVNETMVKKLGIASNQDVIGKKANINGNDGTIVGVVRDFHNKSLHEEIEALCITSANSWYFNCAVKFNPATLQPTLKAVEKIWKGAFPDRVYKYDFLDVQIAKFYEQDYIFLRLIRIFSGIAIVIGCLGLYGLVSFMVTQKTKEVGIRKVLGASVQSIVWLFGREFSLLLLIAFAIAAPLATWAMNNWLENFAYHISIGTGTFLLTVFISLAVAMLTVGYRSVKAALMSPVRSLRSE